MASRGLAIDVMIPNPSSAAGIALGNEIVSFALKNADKFHCRIASGAVRTTRPAGRPDPAMATTTTFTSPLTVGDTPRAGKFTFADRVS